MRERVRERERETDRDRDRQRERERDRETERQRERERERERDIQLTTVLLKWFSVWSSLQGLQNRRGEEYPMKPCVEVAMESVVQFLVTFRPSFFAQRMKLESALNFHNNFHATFRQTL